ncbi:jg22331 [Pararge aegeria aegeria]|uniref:Jg22331 protein n=1 Tax=Pararge aegeria aegeria TaxID=348720 RepID=A0A8S4S4P3_9NEOP|nr:jg22331 [Pararge aegeria aegeria]
MGRAHSSEKGWTLGCRGCKMKKISYWRLSSFYIICIPCAYPLCTILVPRCWNGSPALVSAALVDPQRGGKTTLSASQVAAGSKRHRTVEFGIPCKRPMSSSARLSFDMIMRILFRCQALNHRSFSLQRHLRS